MRPKADVGDLAEALFAADMEKKYTPGNRDSLTARNLIMFFLDLVMPGRDRGNDNVARIAAAKHLGLVEKQT